MPKNFGWIPLVLSVLIGCSSKPLPPEGMVLVPGGTFMMGTMDLPDAQPLQTEVVTSFFLDQTEVTGAAYQACVKSKQCETPA